MKELVKWSPILTVSSTGLESDMTVVLNKTPGNSFYQVSLQKSRGTLVVTCKV